VPSPGHPPFVKHDPNAPPGFFEAEARGLAWLGAVPDGVPTAAVQAVQPGRLTLQRLGHVTPRRSDAEEFGRRLARTHAAGAPVWGGQTGDGFIGPLPLPNGPFSSWADLWWEGRVLPYLRAAIDAGTLSSADGRAVESGVQRRIEGVPETDTPSRVHGDLWSGNVIWTGAGAVLVDAGAAHGGHREADLSMLALFGLPFLNEVLAAYEQQWPLAAEARSRVPLFQLHPLLVHVVLFGAGYAERTRRAAAALR
jgi:fructosamine-3-kinase